MATTTPDQTDTTARRGTLRLVIAFLLVVAAGVALAWFGAGAMRSEISDSGLAFRTVKAGTGEPIATTDAALLDYVLTADDGAVIDSSESHGGPQPFTAAQVFPGFAEAMGRMSEGGEYRFSMPQSLAFGENAAPPGFPAGSKLNFDVRVRKIARGAAAAMLQQQQQMPQQGMDQVPPPGRP